jgi:hypothetical protein
MDRCPLPSRGSKLLLSISASSNPDHPWRTQQELSNCCFARAPLATSPSVLQRSRVLYAFTSELSNSSSPLN